MSQVSMLYHSLKGVLKSKGITYAELVAVVELSEASIKRSMAAESFTLQNLEKICDFVEIRMSELLKLADQSTAHELNQLNYEQELLLASEPIAFVMFYLLASRWTLKKMDKYYQFSERQKNKVFRELESVGLIERHLKGKIISNFYLPLEFLKDGPIQKLYKEKVKESLLNSPKLARDEIEEFMTFELTEPAFEHLQRKTKALIQEAKTLSKIESFQSKEATTSYAMVQVLKPWILDVFEKYQR